MDKAEQAILKHKEWKGKLEVISRAPINNNEELAVAYTPGVAAPCLEIEKDENLAYEYTRKGNMVAVITDGTAVLGLGDIGPAASMPVMEGKCALFKRFADIDAIPICVDTKDVDEFVTTVKNISKSFGGINLEDISAPRCFEIEDRLKAECDIPVFHDDQHGTAVISCAGLLNAVKVTGREMGDLKIVINGAGAAGMSICKLILKMGFGTVTMCDSKGTIWDGNPRNNAAKAEIAKITNPDNIQGTLADAVKDADVFIGVSAPGVLTQDMVRTMAKDPIIFACANPTPEIYPDEAKAAGAAVVGTGRSDFPNQVNNALCFPGLFRGALDVRATEINDEMKVAAAYALAAVISDDELNPDNILPDAFNPEVVKSIAKAAADAAVKCGISRI
ncbi:MAG: NAD-dependent malic enzyme [Clostridia bacterium]|nr:NAD-dependent malic enzyme [Clostridia bacterium]